MIDASWSGMFKVKADLQQPGCALSSPQLGLPFPWRADVSLYVRRGMKVGNFEYVDAPLNLGASLGNQFEIVLRGIEGANSDQVGPASGALRRIISCRDICCMEAQPGRVVQHESAVHRVVSGLITTNSGNIGSALTGCSSCRCSGQEWLCQLLWAAALWHRRHSHPQVWFAPSPLPCTATVACSRYT